MDIYQIRSKLGTRLYLYTLFTCAKYRYNVVTSLYFIAIFCSMRKEIEAPIAPLWRRKKNEEIKMKLWPLISQKRLGRFPSNVVCGVAYLAGTPVVKLVPIG